MRHSSCSVKDMMVDKLFVCAVDCCWKEKKVTSSSPPLTDVFHPLTAGRLKDSPSLQKCVCVGIVPSRAGVSPRDNGRSCNGGEIPLAPLLPNSCWRTVGCVTMAAACDKIGCCSFYISPHFVSLLSLSHAHCSFLLYIHPLVHIQFPSHINTHIYTCSSCLFVFLLQWPR